MTSVDGPGSIALLAQSIGSGAGGNVSAVAVGQTVAFSGNGGFGGAGAAARMTLQAGIFASMNKGGGGVILAPPVGGAGGAPGSGTARFVCVLAFVVCGVGVICARAGNVIIESSALVTV